jgi:hypothetical protein
MKKNINNHTLFAVSFSKGFSSPNIPIATFYQGSKKLNFILDTGSDKNVIDVNALNDIKYEKIEDGEPQTLSGVGGVQEVFECTITFANDEEHYKANFLATDLSAAFQQIEQHHGIILHGMIGSVFLKNNHVVLDYTNMTAYSK